MPFSSYCNGAPLDVIHGALGCRCVQPVVGRELCWCRRRLGESYTLEEG